MVGTTTRFKFTRDAVDAATCSSGKNQALYWDTEQPGLGLRVTAAGAKSFIFESRLGGRTIRMTIGRATMPIRGAKDKLGRPVTIGAATEAARLSALVAQGTDPRAKKAELIASQHASREEARMERARREVSGLDTWGIYLQDRRVRWGDRSYRDHIVMAQPGGERRQRSSLETKPGPLHALLDRPLSEITNEVIERWVTDETAKRPTRTALAFRQLRAFLNWAGEHPDFKDIVNADAHRGRRARERLQRPVAKTDGLQREQLALWFTEVRKLSAAPSAYLQSLLLTGARREELAGLEWNDVDFRWRSLRIRDKVEGERVIPLTDHVADLLRELKVLNETPPPIPRRLRSDREAVERIQREWKPSPWVFSSRSAASGRIQDPRIAHNRALGAAELPHVTLHGLRRSFGTLAEWVECPVGIVAQIQGHKPSAIAEKHYRVRPLDLLRLWHQRIEDWILAEAGIKTTSQKEASPATNQDASS